MHTKHILPTILCVQEMTGALVEYLTTDTQMKLYRGTVVTIYDNCREELEVDDQVLLSYTCNATDLS